VTVLNFIHKVEETPLFGTPSAQLSNHDRPWRYDEMWG